MFPMALTLFDKPILFFLVMIVIVMISAAADQNNISHSFVY